MPYTIANFTAITAANITTITAAIITTNINT